MSLQPFYPTRISDQVVWHDNLATELPSQASSLHQTPAFITDLIADNKSMSYTLGLYLTGARQVGQAATASVDDARFGNSGGAPVVLAFFPLPALPAGTVLRPAGALNRIFRDLAILKLDSGYTEAMGQLLRLIGAQDNTVQAQPKITLIVEQGPTCQCVRIPFSKYQHMGIYLEGRINGGAWEFIAVDTESPYIDARPLLVANTPEIREYRARFWDKGLPNGLWTDVARTTVSP